MATAARRLSHGPVPEQVKAAGDTTLLTGASAGIGAPNHIASELFKHMAGVDIVHIPFKGGGPAMIDVMSGNSHMIIGTVVQALPHVGSGKLVDLIQSCHDPRRLPDN